MSIGSPFSHFFNTLSDRLVSDGFALFFLAAPRSAFATGFRSETEGAPCTTTIHIPPSVLILPRIRLT